MKIVSWNVNGIRACVNKGFVEFVQNIAPDIVCLQEIKSDEISANLTLDGYEQYWNPANKKGYAGTAIFTKVRATNALLGINKSFLDEGRVITLSYPNFYLINCYSPHSRRDLSHLEYKHKFNCALNNYVQFLNSRKPVILCGDLNVAHQDIDIANYKSNKGNAGFTQIERDDFDCLLSVGLVDSFRLLYPQKGGAYTWWSYMKDVRNRNIGWRIDYALISEEIAHNINDAMIYSNVFGSDHCPIGLDINMEAY